MPRLTIYETHYNQSTDIRGDDHYYPLYSENSTLKGWTLPTYISELHRAGWVIDAASDNWVKMRLSNGTARETVQAIVEG